MTINYSGHTLQQSYIDRLFQSGQEFNTPPSLYISQLYYESNWGTSTVAQQNNNWGGLTWTGNPNRPSGVVVSRGTPRPSDEGGYYMRFDSVDDYLIDYIYLLNQQGLYNISGHDTFEDSVKGLFTVGGAKVNYATTHWQTYVNTMVSIRNGINNNNGNILDDLDGGLGGGGGGKPFFPTTKGLEITSPYGWRNHPITGEWHFHPAIDIGGGGVNHPIYATQSGMVIYNQFTSGGGWVIRIAHSGDNYFSQYQHLDSKSPLDIGDTVTKGQEIGTMGTSGSSTGVHLDFAIAIHGGGFFTEDGTIDPEIYLQMDFGDGGEVPSTGSKDIITMLLCGALNGWE